MHGRSVSRILIGTAAAALLCACGRGDGFGLPGGLIGGANGGTSGHATSAGSAGTGSPGASGGNATVGGTGIGGRTSGAGGDSAGGSAGTGGATTGGPACLTLDDCPALDTICFNGFCTTNACGPTGKPGPQNGALDSTCNVQGSNDGSCIPAVVNGDSVGLCTQGGSANAACNPGATRPQGLLDACPAGDVCLDQLGGAQCFVLCDPFAAETTCVAGDSCVRPLPSNNRLGVCEPLGTNTGGTAGGTGGTGNTGGGTGGNGTGGTGGNCNPDITSTQEFQGCASSQCGCPFTCVDDPVAQAELCERQGCATHPCTSALTACDAESGICELVACGAATGNGAFNASCVMPDGSAGTCAPVTFDGFDSVGLCERAGTATTNCDPNPTLQDPPSLLCAPGTACFGGFAHSNGRCNALCSFNDPNSICPDGQFCSGIVNEPDLGICIND